MRKRIEAWKIKFRDLRLFQKIMVTFLITALLIYMMMALTLQIAFRIYDRHLYEKSQAELDFFAQQVNERLAQIEALTVSIATGNAVQDKLSQMGEMEYLSREYNYAKQQLMGILQNQIFSQDVIRNVIYTDQRQVTFTAGMYTGPIKPQVMEMLLQQFHEKRGGYVSFSPTEDYPYLLTGRDILEVKNATLDYMGSLIFSCDIAKLIKRQANNLEAEHATLLVYSEQGMIYQEAELQDLKLPDMSQERGWRVMNYQGERTFLCYEKSRETGWMYVNFFPYSEIYGQVLRLRYLVSVIIAAVFAGAVLALRRISWAMTRPLEQLTESMKVVEQGDFKGAKKLLPQNLSGNEAGRLAREFDTMLTQIDCLIHENYEKQLLIKDTKYRMLQSQINPHFLYNTLNSLNWMVKAGSCDDASRMIVELGSLLRGVLSPKIYVTAREELAMLESYVAIQQYRYKNRAQFLVVAEGELEAYFVPKMILQPLVENAISYGVDCSLKLCQVLIQAKEREGILFLTVQDQGPGMTPQELEQVREGTCKPKGHGIGLANIRERLALVSAEAALRVDSVPGEGTKITIQIPRLTEDSGAFSEPERNKRMDGQQGAENV